MYRKATLFTLVSALFLALTACGSPASAPQEPPASDPVDPGQPAQEVSTDPSIPPLPEDWMQVPNTALVYYSPGSYEVEHTNTRVNIRGWVMLAPEADYRDFEQFNNAVLSWYAMMADEHADFDKIDDAYYAWGDTEIRIEADKDPDDYWQVLFTINEREPIDPDQPLE
jgi:hypothetical protein